MVAEDEAAVQSLQREMAENQIRRLIRFCGQTEHRGMIQHILEKDVVPSLLYTINSNSVSSPWPTPLSCEQTDCNEPA